MRIAKRLGITGRVQGVWYRGWTVETARGLDLTGWVRNRPDGSVEAYAAGEPDAVARFVERCREGPPAARVEHVAVEDAAVEPHDGFHQRSDG